MTGCRISRIKLKSGGEIHRLPVLERDEVQKDLVSAAVKTVELYDPGEIHGYVVFAWGKGGHSSVSYFLSEDSVVRTRLMPSYTADAIRDKLINAGDWG